MECKFVVFLSLLFCSLTHSRQTLAAPPYAPKLGVDLDGISDGSREKPFVDLAKTIRPWACVGGGDKPVPLDAKQWPKTDAATVLFDIRPAFAWAPPIDDPDAFQPDWSGTYHVSFDGKADLKIVEGTGCRVEKPTYSTAKNRSQAELVVPKGTGVLVVSFTKTKRDPKSKENSGITNLRIIRPGYPAETKQTFTTEFLKSLEPFTILRYMDWLDTNHQPGFYGDKGHHALTWKNRRLPDDATQVSLGEKYGVAWEYVVDLANTTEKDLWINIPIAATDEYVRDLAVFLKHNLKPNLKVYIEHSNEVWNFGFPQYIYNKLAAVDEVERGKKTLNRDGSNDQEVWARRRHALRLIEIGDAFRAAFDEKGSQGRIRPIYASWVIFPGPYYADILDWVAKNRGKPGELFYGIAGAAYFNIEKAPKDASVDQLLDAMRASSDEHEGLRKQIQAIADRFKLKHCQYEIGPDVGGGKTDNVANRIRANRNVRMHEIILHDAIDNWFSKGGDIYMYFSHISGYSRYGCWGLSEDVADLSTPKWRAIRELSTGGR